MRGALGGKRRQASRMRRFPPRRARLAATDRARPGCASASGIGMRAITGAGRIAGPRPPSTTSPPWSKQPDADAGARTATEPDRIGRDIERQAVQPPHARPRPRARAACRSRARHAPEPLRRSSTRWPPPRPRSRRIDVEIARRRDRFPVRSISRRRAAFDRDARLQIADRKADAAETTPEPAVEIEKAEMQSRRNGDRHARPGSAKRSFASVVSRGFIRRSGFSESNTRARLRHRGLRLAISSRIGNRLRAEVGMP